MVDASTKIAGITGGVGLVILVIGCVLIPVFDILATDTVVESVRLVEGTQGYENYIVPASPIILQFWFFNLTNPEDVINNSSTPRLEQVGPYTYSVDKPKEELKFQNSDSELLYKINSTYHFVPEMSPGVDPYTDSIINVNFVVLTLAKLGENLPDNIKALVQEAIEASDPSLFQRFLVNDYLWGYNDSTAANIPFLPDIWGLYYGFNESHSVEFAVNTGLNYVNLVNEVIRWRENQTLTTAQGKAMWSTDKCNSIDGTDGTQFKPFVEKDDILYIFSGQVCRSFKTIYESDVTVKGIDLLRFVLDPLSFANYTENPDNAGYCIPDQDNCLPSGFLNLENCFFPVPLVGSMPHFYLGEQLLGNVEGLSPNREEHQITVDVEPTTGFTLQGHKRLQINILIEPWSLFPDTNASIFQDGFIFPIFWLNESSIISDEDAEVYISDIIEPIELLEIIQFVVIGVGAFVMLCALVVFVGMRFRKK